MNKLSPQEEKELLDFIKVWLKSHGYTQKDLANELNLKSSRTSEITKKIKEFHKKGGVYHIAKNLIKIEQNWLNNIPTDSEKEKENHSYNQLDIDSLVNQIKKDSL
ncbi:conserved hypothetical protein [Prochlorococcus marinus str. MIT 9515]|uniref:Uncharacterized protein n=1 Tax=Prochlorococcus marinus (strain MIT 9515) TaxID=167542 RepID=A2BVN8_PROM5|nr:hypothetical protein [Prochlorococcus marinus]ABM71849.1 conserved hypothetical protein [Prochlorococcus marinus str. MIT 9515]